MWEAVTEHECFITVFEYDPALEAASGEDSNFEMSWCNVAKAPEFALIDSISWGFEEFLATSGSGDRSRSEISPVLPVFFPCLCAFIFLDFFDLFFFGVVTGQFVVENSTLAGEPSIPGAGFKAASSEAVGESVVFLTSLVVVAVSAVFCSSIIGSSFSDDPEGCLQRLPFLDNSTPSVAGAPDSLPLPTRVDNSLKEGVPSSFFVDGLSLSLPEQLAKRSGGGIASGTYFNFVDWSEFTFGVPE